MKKTFVFLFVMSFFMAEAQHDKPAQTSPPRQASIFSLFAQEVSDLANTRMSEKNQLNKLQALLEEYKPKIDRRLETLNKSKRNGNSSDAYRSTATAKASKRSQDTEELATKTGKDKMGAKGSTGGGTTKPTGRNDRSNLDNLDDDAATAGQMGTPSTKGKGKGTNGSSSSSTSNNNSDSEELANKMERAKKKAKKMKDLQEALDAVEEQISSGKSPRAALASAKKDICTSCHRVLTQVMNGAGKRAYDTYDDKPSTGGSVILKQSKRERCNKEITERTELRYLGIMAYEKGQFVFLVAAGKCSKKMNVDTKNIRTDLCYRYVTRDKVTCWK